MITKIISGGQTGVDRAALDLAIALQIPHGGWCPKGRRAELGAAIPDQYNLVETESDDYTVRTKFNIRDSNGTLILVPKMPINVTDGTVQTIDEVKEKQRPYLIVDLSSPPKVDEIIDWITKNNIQILNIAGPRESQSPGIYKLSFAFLENVLVKEIMNDAIHRKHSP